MVYNDWFVSIETCSDTLKKVVLIFMLKYVDFLAVLKNYGYKWLRIKIMYYISFSERKVWLNFVIIQDYQIFDGSAEA